MLLSKSSSVRIVKVVPPVIFRLQNLFDLRSYISHVFLWNTQEKCIQSNDSYYVKSVLMKLEYLLRLGSIVSWTDEAGLPRCQSGDRLESGLA